MGGSARGRAATALGLGTVLLALVWRTAPLPSPPMYEGLTTPAEAYRYLHPPPGLESAKRPSSARMTAPLRQGQSPPLDPQTTEMPPQAQLLAAQDSFVLPTGATSVVATIDPVDPPPVPPIGGAIQGNVYRITVTAAGAAVAVRPGRRITVALRGPAGIPSPTVELFSAGAWTRLTTEPLGTLSGDTYTADVGSTGDFALVGSAAPPSGGGDPFVIVLAVAAVVLAGGTLISLRRRGRTPPRPRPGAGRSRRPPIPRRR